MFVKKEERDDEDDDGITMTMMIMINAHCNESLVFLLKDSRF